MILIADSGSTRTEWYVIRPGHPGIRLETMSFNPFFTSRQQMDDAIDKDLAPFFYPEKIESLFFYGAGMGLQVNRDKIADVLHEHFENADIDVMTDMLGAARALFRHGSGVACILGTGSNSCVYKEGRIVHQPPSLGYILGDEGGGVHMGKAFLSSYIRKSLPEELRLKFFTRYKKDESTIVESIYRLPGPNAFIASFTPFLKENLEHPFVESLVEASFAQFFNNMLLPAGLSDNLSYGFAGSIAFHFQDTLLKTMKGLGIQPGPFIASPIEGLVTYHSPE